MCSEFTIIMQFCSFYRSLFTPFSRFSIVMLSMYLFAGIWGVTLKFMCTTDMWESKNRIIFEFLFITHSVVHQKYCYENMGNEMQKLLLVQPCILRLSKRLNLFINSRYSYHFNAFWTNAPVYFYAFKRIEINSNGLIINSLSGKK